MTQLHSPEYLINTLKESHKLEGVTLVLCFSRRWCVAPFFEVFKKLNFCCKLKKESFHLLIFDNSDNALLQNELLAQLESFKEGWCSVRYYKTWRQGGQVIRGEINNDFYKSKIYPISEMQHDIVNLVYTDKFIQLEDDEVPQNLNVIPKLLALLQLKGVGIASGVSCARSPIKAKCGMGVHQLVALENDRIIKRICCAPACTGIREVQATGFYCFATYTEIWRHALERARKVASGLPHWAFDTWVTHQVYLAGHKILARFDCWCDHIQIMGAEVYRYNQKDAVLDCYIYIPELKVYAYWQNSPAYGWVLDSISAQEVLVR